MSTYKQLTEAVNRKCRPETILRLLTSTSYPQSTLADLTLKIAVQGGKTDEDELEQDALAMREVEKSYGLFDFVRRIELKRSGDEVKVTTMCLDVDPNMKTIHDGTATHDHMATSTINLTNGDAPLQDPNSLAVTLLELFYRSQIKPKQRGNSIDKTTWRYHTKVPQRQTGEPQPDQDLTATQAIQKLANSLRKKFFHVVLTQNTILLLDQKARLYGVSIK